MKILLPLAAIAAGFLVSPAAQAQTEPNQTRTVRVADLRLDTPVGVATLDRRIRVAARDVCAPAASYVRSQRALAMLCEKETIAAVAPQRSAAVQSGRAIQLSAR